MKLSDEEIYDMLPVAKEFNSADLNEILGDKLELHSEHDKIPYKTSWRWSIDTESILSRMRDKGMVMRSTGVHCHWYVKKGKY